MKAPNHIIGGVVFTGIFASLWNVNVFSTVDLFLFTVVSTLLPDIDHPKSILGKMFYPISKALERNYGHRTITHSLLFLVVVSLISFSIEKHFFETSNYSIALFFAIFSHLILDMVTIQGIPLFYPFAKNPCVIPGNPRFRLRSSDYRAELMAFALFFFIGASCVNLFKHGFWTSYNRFFGTIRHLYREDRNADNLILVDYDYIHNSNEYTGKGYLLSSSQYKAVLFDDRVIVLDSRDETTIVKSVKPSNTLYPKVIKELMFFNITKDSLISLCSGKVISGQIQSSEPVEIIEDNIRKRSNLFNFEFVYNFSISFLVDSTRLSLADQLKKKEIKLAQEKQEHLKKFNQIKQLRIACKKVENKVRIESDLYLKNKLQNELIDMRVKLETAESGLINYYPDPILLFEIESLKRSLNQEHQILFSGIINYPELIK
jgi:inner membrane protein